MLLANQTAFIIFNAINLFVYFEFSFSVYKQQKRLGTQIFEEQNFGFHCFLLHTSPL